MTFLHSQSKPPTYGWGVICVELLCGIVAIVWYVIAFAERTTLRTLTRLEKFAASLLGDHPNDKPAKKILVLDEALSCFERRNSPPSL